MNSERAALGLSLVLVVGLAACADLERGPHLDAGVVAADAGPPGTDLAGQTPDAAALSFARDVHPLLLAACAVCHSETGAASRSSFLLVRDPGKDRVQVAKFVNPEQPAGSRLLSKGTGMGHEGGAALAAGTPEYQTILAWITQGSLP